MSSLKAFAKEAKKNAAVLPQKNQPLRKDIIPSAFSSERMQDSSEEEEESAEDSSSDDEPVPKKQMTPLPKANGRAARPKATAPQESSSDDSDLDTGSSDSDAPAQSPAGATTSNAKVARPKQPASESSVSSSGSDSSSESSDESEAEGSVAITASATMAPTVFKPIRLAPKDPKIVTFTQPDDFIPPTGFKLQSISDNAKASDLLHKSNLKGKQMWYITAPASVSKEAIETMVWPRDVREKAVIKFNGIEYAFVEGTAEAKASTQFMVPDSSRDGYRPIFKSVDNILHLQQKVELLTTAAQSTLATVPAKKPVRQQPKGLKMRYKPSGSGDSEAGKIGSSSEDESPAAPVRFQKRVSVSPEPSNEKSGSSEDSASSSDSGSDSDVEMNDATAPVAKPITPKPTPLAKKSAAILPPTAGALKRKHAVETPKKISSSSKEFTNTPVLNNVKNITKPQNQQADKALASIETNTKVGSSIPSPKRLKPNNHASSPSSTPWMLSSTATHPTGRSPVPLPPKSTAHLGSSRPRSILKHSSSNLKGAAKQSPMPPPASTARPNVQLSPIPAPAVRFSPIPPPSSLLASNAKSKSNAFLPSIVRKATPAVPITLTASSSSVLPKKKTVNQAPAPALSGTPILPPQSLLRTMSSQSSVTSSITAPSSGRDKGKEGTSKVAEERTARKALENMRK
ncbi:DNA-directed RNA polymerase I subunit RPA34.5-domain-containing protein [Calycina marina]|uniref:DNA-directed RNA polymerase I subunit RPA34.5-domain-containing protein n=1 Tax=Calycina marina TaxID=1763456 RepID=A0A9P8CK57_9HELO|nr:DNA-directed RNA polymerase I subunit RPA34.5-domain-containing protein [Calycina marina]